MDQEEAGYDEVIAAVRFLVRAALQVVDEGQVSPKYSTGFSVLEEDPTLMLKAYIGFASASFGMLVGLLQEHEQYEDIDLEKTIVDTATVMYAMAEFEMERENDDGRTA